MAKQEDIFKNVISHAKEYGFIFPSSEIYDGLSAVYDCTRIELKRTRWKSMVQMNDNIVGLDASILMHPTTWNLDMLTFNPLIDNKRRYRADVLMKIMLKAKY
jgi:glycyl-tRNA synthetase